ncbi:MAG: hypothetical protein GY719_12185 [bacterium]|nr:hypothetical protein [bacterium]
MPNRSRSFRACLELLAFASLLLAVPARSREGVPSLAGVALAPPASELIEPGDDPANRVEPFFYQRPLFLAALALLAAAAGFGAYRWRMRAAEARHAHLEGIIARQRAAERARQRLIRKLETSNAELERYAYTVSHDLKSPLITIRNFLGVLGQDLERGDHERAKRDIARIHAAAGKMGQLLEELLELSRIGRLVNSPEELALRELAEEACDLVSGAIRERGAKVEVARDLPSVRGDRARLIEVYQNLVENAVKHASGNEAPRIEIGWRRDGAEPVAGDPIFFVHDDGIGIEPEYHDKIFGLFERLDPAVEGTGVGLALVKRIVEVHGGRIWVESEGAGRGSTFCFTLPG